MKRLVLASSNPGKIAEIAALLAPLAIEVVPQSYYAIEEAEEPHGSFVENALAKARHASRACGLPALADDSGLCVDALGGAPGVRSARWSEEEPGPEPTSPVCELPGAAAGELGAEAGRAARDERNNDKLLRALARVPDERRGAEYQAALALARPDGTIVASVSGACRGRIGRVRRGTGGFGYDPLFVPTPPIAPGQPHPSPAPASDRTMAELSPDEKDGLSHRGEALRRLRPVLERLVPYLDERGSKR